MEPVSTPCGHSFCKACLQGYWTHSKKFICPMCKKNYSRKPEMSVNRVLAEISSQFQGLMLPGGAAEAVGAVGAGGGATRGSTMNLSSNVRHGGSPGPDTGEFARAGEVPCDACIGRKVKALKSCVNCPGSYCEVHLRHHKKVRFFSSLGLLQDNKYLFSFFLTMPFLAPFCYYFISSTHHIMYILCICLLNNFTIVTSYCILHILY